ncbi:MAG: hypothetical protein P1U58_19300, partial [Verrucomicrobiales bacterium]|nr:hypothetical protein [Verrucomicrobiales bacterium]
MPNLLDYYNDLLSWEGEPPQILVDAWPQPLRTAIENNLVQAVAVAGLIGSICPIQPGSKNQSIGNQVEAFTVSALAPHLSNVQLMPCSGSGYPDKMLIERGTGLAIPLEMKATSDWNPRDSNRRVLTSSSKKLRAQFRSPRLHLLATVIYSPVANGVRIDHLRLD